MFPKPEAEPRAGRGMPAVSIRQPLASSLASRPGSFEYPAWETDYRGPLLIHAAKRGPGDPPTERSGSPASLVPWDDLGLQGRNFVGTGPTPEQLQAFSGRPAKEPVRAYVGLASGSDVTDRAALAVRDLERAGGFDRSVLVVGYRHNLLTQELRDASQHAIP